MNRMRKPKQRGIPEIVTITILKRLTVFTLFLLAACQVSPTVLVATPVPPDSTFHTYRYPNGAFSIRLPADWSVRDVSRGNAVRVEFSPPGNTGLPMTVYVVNTGTVLDAPSLLDAINKYQSVVNGDASVYTEASRNAQGDGSWRLAGIRQTSIGPRQLNTFLQADKSFLTAIEVDITGADETRLNLFRTIINTYRADPTAVLTANPLSSAPDLGVNTSSGSITFAGMFAWTDSSGSFNINGELGNASDTALEAVRVTALLYDDQNRVLAEQGDVIASDVVAPNDSASFSIRFRTGKPSQAVRYELQASGRNAEYNLQNYLGPESFIKGNEKASYNAAGYLVISGDVVNQTKQPAHSIRVTITVRDEQNHIVGAENAFIEKPDLLPGDTSHYEVTFYQLAGNAARFITKIEGRRS